MTVTQIMNVTAPAALIGVRKAVTPQKIDHTVVTMIGADLVDRLTLVDIDIVVQTTVALTVNLIVDIEIILPVGIDVLTVTIVVDVDKIPMTIVRDMIVV